MKKLIMLLGLLSLACQGKQERYRREASFFPRDLVGKWQALATMQGAHVFQAGISIRPSGDSLLWQYFSQIVDTSTQQVVPCGPQMEFMPIIWDDSLHVARANHGVGQGYGYDNLVLLTGEKLQMNSYSLAPFCRGPFGMNSTKLQFSKVTSFLNQP